jgi:SAM-dependent methyltransferase
VASAPTSYDLLPYSSKPYALTHPDNLATVAGLAGMRPPHVEQCRVLELGCGAGGNLIPMALSLPGASFVGIDLSSRQIADGQALAATLGLTNIRLRRLNILDVDASFGRFDFIICHGVISWVPTVVQEAILAICQRNLAEDGVAFVSYNAYPGWHLKGLVREMLLQRIHTDAEPREQIRQARSVVDQVSRALAGQGDAYSRLLKHQLALAASASDTYLFHDYLEAVNQPLYVHQFAERAAAHGLRYLGDAKLRSTAPPAPDRVEREQYVDMLVNRTFRRSLVCRADVRLDPAVGAASLRASHARARVRPVSAVPDIDSDRAEEFRTPSGKPWSTKDHREKALLVSVARRHPATISFAELSAAVGHLLGADPGSDDVADCLLRCWLAELVDLHLHPPRLPEQIAERPTASPLARVQAETGTEVTNLRHHTVELDPLAQAMLRCLDGTHDLASLAAELRALAEKEPPPNEHDGGADSPARPERWREDIDGSLERMLRYFQRSALLVS